MFIAALVAFVSAGVAGAASAPIVVAKSPVTALAAEGHQLAFAATSGTCDRVFVWNDVSRRSLQLGRKQHCPSVHGIESVAFSGGRAMWLTWGGDRIREWQLWTASTAARTPRELASATQVAGVSEAAPIVVGRAGGGLLPYAGGAAVTVLRADGTSFNWMAPAPVAALAATAGKVAVADAGSRVTVLNTRGKIVSVNLYAGAVDAVAFVTNGLLVQRGTVLESRRGAEAHELQISSTGRLECAAATRAVWSDGKRVHVIRIPDEAQTAVFKGSHGSLAGKRLYVASGRSITQRTIR